MRLGARAERAMLNGCMDNDNWCGLKALKPDICSTATAYI